MGERLAFHLQTIQFQIKNHSQTSLDRLISLLAELRPHCCSPYLLQRLRPCLGWTRKVAPVILQHRHDLFGALFVRVAALRLARRSALGRNAHIFQRTFLCWAGPAFLNGVFGVVGELRLGHRLLFGWMFGQRVLELGHGLVLIQELFVVWLILGKQCVDFPAVVTDLETTVIVESQTHWLEDGLLDRLEVCEELQL